MRATTGQIVLGAVLITLGVLLLIGRFTIAALLPYAGIVLVVLGVLMLIGAIRAGLLVGVATLVVGILLMVNFITFPEGLRDFMRSTMDVINLVAGILLILLGILKVAGR